MQTIETIDGSQEMSYQIIEALAAVENRDALSMNPPLYEAVDPDAIDSLLDTDDTVEVQFEYNGHTVTANSDGSISIDGVTHKTAEEGASSTTSPVFGQEVHTDD